jgi:hypothetical protein
VKHLNLSDVRNPDSAPQVIFHQIKVASEVATSGETLIVNLPQHPNRKPPNLRAVFQMVNELPDRHLQVLVCLRRMFDAAEQAVGTPVGTLTQRHGHLIGTEPQGIELCGPGHRPGLGGIDGMVRGLAQPFPARQFGNEAAFASFRLI